MEPSEFLDILGNENRRKILSLLAERPYYVSEISTRLGVAPKAVIGHLTLLESIGLIESSTDVQRRKYYSITKSFHLEVSVSPYSYSVHINHIKIEIPDEPTYSLSLSSDPEEKTNRRRGRKKTTETKTEPIIHLAPSYPNENEMRMIIEIVNQIRLNLTGEQKKYLPAQNDKTEFDAAGKKFFEEELNTVLESEKKEKIVEPEIIFPQKEPKKKKDSGRLQSRDSYFLTQIQNIRLGLEMLWEEHQELTQKQEELSVRQNQLMNAFVHYTAQLSEDKIDLDILFRLLKKDMNTADLCHETGHAPSLILPRLKAFEDKKLVEKYLSGGDFVWCLRDGSDV
ncbi:MAG: ArsR family transcriptional regulator [Methanimicrococcus sp.]|nr:ArsR family transcriptional regulator [Methanimicrococcus sp.]